MMRKLLSHRLGGTVLFYFLFVAVAFLTRLALLVSSWADVDRSPLKLFGIFACGLVYDVGAASFGAIVIIFYLLLLPQRWFASRLHRRLSILFFFGVLSLLVFNAVAEWVFWDEFGARFNFIAVDYLIYTHEVISNIRESYPMPLIFGGIFAVAALLQWGLWKTGWMQLWLASQSTWRNRWRWSCGLLLAPVFFLLVMQNRQVPAFGNVYNQELARNGVFSIFAAWRENEIRYDQFYVTRTDGQLFPRLRELLQEDNTEFVSPDPTNITRRVRHDGEEKHWNVIQITVESLSSIYLGKFGNQRQLTPNLDNLCENGLFFTSCYATGSRTVRGMEALTLSVPPTPGQSIVKRPHNENLFSLGSLLRTRGYDTTFLYGGYGYFDNMNYFFSANGYKIVDRTQARAEDITFANAWGACDEDVYNWSLREADASFAAGRPFHHFIMTTSNHRPYTYPDGKIDIPSHTGRDGAVKYTDYAIGAFIGRAQTKPWFKDTLFVIVADHCANNAGKADLPIKKFEIPLIIYNPHLVQPRAVNTFCSQIDFAPTLLGLLNWSYSTRFYGKDILRMRPKDERTFIANYQKLGLMKAGHLAILEPVRKQNFYQYDRETGDLQPVVPDPAFLADTVTYYETASYLFAHHLDGPVTSQDLRK